MGLGVLGHPEPSLRIPDCDYVTPLYIEMKIATQYLHCSHAEFLDLPIEERMKLIFFEEMTEAYKNHEREKQNQQMQNRQQADRYRG